MNRIQQTIDLILAGKITVERKPDYCLRVVRQTIEHANNWPGGALYNHTNIWSYLTATNRHLAPSIPWAASLEQACIAQGWTIPQALVRPGDAVFSRVPANEGHVGIVGMDEQGRLCVLENATVRRGRSLGGALNWVPLADWHGLTTVGRFPEHWVFDRPPQTAPPAPIPDVTAPSTQRIVVTDGGGRFVDRTGQRTVVSLTGGWQLIVNATDPVTVWVDVRLEGK